MKKYRSVLIFVLLLACVFLVFYLTDSSGKGEKINTNDVVSLIKTNQEGTTTSVVAEIYMSNGSGKILLRGSSINKKNFPSKADYYFSYGSSEDIKGIIKAINKYNSGKTLEDATRVGYNSQIAQASFLESAMPYISIIILLVFGFFLVKTILGANNKNFSFGKTKARMAQNVKVTFADVAGVDEEKEELQEVVEFLKNPQKFTELGAKIPKGILLVGLPGTGKTLLAKAIAGESNVPFFSISGSDFVEMFVGVGASRVRDLFDQAKKNSPCIVFIDEIDAVGRQRGAGLGGGNDEREQTLNQLLVQMDGFEPNEGIIVIAATNRSDVLDPALLRPGRFDRQIHVNPPDVKGREKIIEVHSKNKPLDSSVNIKTIARLTSGFTGADIENLMNEAAIYTAKCGRKKITMTDITEGINKVLMGPQKKSRVMTESDKKITACHESGHAIVGNVLENCDNVQEVSIIPRGAAAGYTISRPDKDDNHLTLNKLNDLIAMMLAGRVSEEIVMKDISTGAQNDIQRATQIARKMVTSWGMSRNLGTVDLSGSEEVFIGRDYQMQKPYSEDTASKVDEEIRHIIDYNYKRAKDIITANIDKLNTMSEVLLERETIYAEEVKMIMEGKTAKTIVKKMDKEAEKTKMLNKKNSAEAELETIRKEQTVRLKTAEALRSAGIISADEFLKVKEETAKLINDAEDKFDKISKELEEKQQPKKLEVKVSDMIKTDNQEKTSTTETKTEVKKSTKKVETKTNKEKSDKDSKGKDKKDK